MSEVDDANKLLWDAFVDEPYSGPLHGTTRLDDFEDIDKYFANRTWSQFDIQIPDRELMFLLTTEAFVYFLPGLASGLVQDVEGKADVLYDYFDSVMTPASSDSSDLQKKRWELIDSMSHLQKRALGAAHAVVTKRHPEYWPTADDDARIAYWERYID